MFEKRGLSAVVTTLIIILLALVAIGIVWVVVRNILQEGSEEISLGQFVYDLSIKSASIDGSDVKVNVRRSPGGGELAGINFIFYDGTNSYILERKIALSELEERTFVFVSAEVGGDINALQEVSIAPIFVSAGNEKTGDITDTADIIGSGTGGTNGGTNGGNGNGGSGSGTCGDGTIQTPNGDGVNELCDGSNLNSQTCGSLGLGTGTLSCDAGCQFDTSQCSGGTPSSCDGTWSPPEDAGVVCDGTPLPNNCLVTCVCEVGFTADGAGGCNLNPFLNTGTINSIWNNIFFDSHNLPKDVSVSDYQGDYVNFSASAETNCFQINFASYLNATDISYLRVDDTLSTPNIAAGEGYSIWEAVNCGL